MVWQRAGKFGRIPVLRPILFTSGFVGVTFGACIYIRSEQVWQDHQNGRLTWSNTEDIFKKLFGKPSSSGLIHRQPTLLDHIAPDFVLNLRDIVELKWEAADKSTKLVWGLIGLNVLVFGAWQIPRWSAFMTRHFLHVPGAGRSYTAFTASFSHQQIMHLGFNMMALNGFFPLFQYSAGLSPEQTLAFYLSAGAISGLGSHLYAALMPSRAFIGSLGASGAVWALLAGSTLFNPKSHVGIMFIPGISFTMEELVPVMIGLDIMGLLLRWSTFDHAAHLTGAAFGFAYSLYGPKWWAEVQSELLEYRRRR